MRATSSTPGQEALAFIDDLARDNMGVLLDAYHMNIEEADPAGAIRQAGSKLWLYHAADSNRQAVGRGIRTLKEQLGRAARYWLSRTDYSRVHGARPRSLYTGQRRGLPGLAGELFA